MRTLRNYTVGLEQETADRVIALTRAFGGSVGGFAKLWVTDLSKLNPEQLRKLQSMVMAWQTANEAESVHKS